MKRIFCLVIGFVLICSLSACQKAVSPSGDAPDEQTIVEDATAYFNQMLSGDFETLYNALPQGVKEKTSVQAMQDDWNKESENVGGLPEKVSPTVSCYTPENSEQLRVEFVTHCENGDFKVFINYSADGKLYNYVIWQNANS